MQRLIRVAGAAMALTLAAQAGTAAAQNRNGQPYFGSVTLNSGYTPDPYTVEISAGGRNDASRLGRDCRGRIGDAPDFRLTYRAGSDFPLYIRAIAEDGRDITLAVATPRNGWVCDDDSLGNLNPEITFANPSSGVYNIWLGTFAEGSQSRARLEISEIPFQNNDGDDTDGPGGGGASGPLGGMSDSGLASALDFSANALSGTYTLRAGFTPDPRRYNVTAGGNVRVNNFDGRCAGFVSREPDIRVNYTAGSLPLVFRTRSSGDTTLIVNDGSGNWYCDDDGAGELDAKVVVTNPTNGQFDVWIGTYSEERQRATLEVSEINN